MDRVGKVKIPLFDLVSRVQNLQFNKAVENSVRTSLTYTIKRQYGKFVKNKKGSLATAVMLLNGNRTVNKLIKNKTYYLKKSTKSQKEMVKNK